MGDIRNGNGVSWYNDVGDSGKGASREQREREAREFRAQEREGKLPTWFLTHCYKVVAFYQDQNPDLVDHRDVAVFQYADEQGDYYKRGQIICFCSETGYDDVKPYANGLWTVVWDGGKKWRVEIEQSEWEAIQKMLTPRGGNGHMWPEGVHGYHRYGLRSHFGNCCQTSKLGTGIHSRCLEEGGDPRTTEYPNPPQIYWP